jgi:hypothetical protein
LRFESAVPDGSSFNDHVANYRPTEADPNRISYDCVFLNEIVVPEPDSNPEIVFARIRVPVPRDQIFFDPVVVAADNHAADIQPHELDFSATIWDVAVPY